MERHVNEIFNDPYYGDVICLSADAVSGISCSACIYGGHHFRCGSDDSLMGQCDGFKRRDRQDVYFDLFP